MMNGAENTTTVFIIAASVIVRAGLEAVLREKDEFIIKGRAAEISAAPSAFSIGESADVILVNIGREKDFDDLQEFLNDSPEEMNSSWVVMLVPAELQSSAYTLRALHSGARGILPHDATAGEIIAAVTSAANNLIAVPPETMEKLLSLSPAEDLPAPLSEGSKDTLPEGLAEHLTVREREILEMLADGVSNKTIAYQLNISEHTVKFHVASVFGKLGVNTRTEAVTQGLRRGLILL